MGSGGAPANSSKGLPGMEDTGGFMTDAKWMNQMETPSCVFILFYFFFFCMFLFVVVVVVVVLLGWGRGGV